MLAGEIHTAGTATSWTLESWPRRTPDAERALETPRYLDLEGDQLYTVTHAALRPRRATVLLCGPFAIERERAYLALVCWARMLAARGFEVLRFDYRGQGESTGSFEDMTLARWREDAAFCAARIRAATLGGGLVLQGVRMGALIAAELFAAGVGDGLLLWAPPVSAQDLLRETLRHHLITLSMAERGAPPRTREQLIAALEGGQEINVDGYFWTQALWKEAQRHALLLPAAHERRPWRALQAGAGQPRAYVGTRMLASSEPGIEARKETRMETVDADRFWNSSSPLLVPRSEGFCRASSSWLDEYPWHPKGN